MTASLVIAPHPDDEVLGACSVVAAGSVVVSHVTDGVPPWTPAAESDGLAAGRLAESRAATEVLGGVEETVALGFGDLVSWQSVDRIADALTTLIDRLRPEAVYLPAFQGGHPDHDATCVAGVLARGALGPAPTSWWVYGLYGFDDAGQVRYGWLPPSIYRGVVEVGAGREELAAKGTALRCFESQVWPDSALDQWLHHPVPEQVAPLPEHWERLPACRAYYDEVLGFAEHGADARTVRARLEQALGVTPAES
jgi:N-acetylglucosamine malate deacetylase 2